MLPHFSFQHVLESLNWGGGSLKICTAPNCCKENKTEPALIEYSKRFFLLWDNLCSIPGALNWMWFCPGWGWELDNTCLRFVSWPEGRRSLSFAVSWHPGQSLGQSWYGVSICQACVSWRRRHLNLGGSGWSSPVFWALLILEEVLQSSTPNPEWLKPLLPHF